MDYVCRVVGDMSIKEKDFTLEVSHNEIIDLSPEDFKISPRLREALRNKEIEIYLPSVHREARRARREQKKSPIKERVVEKSTQKEVTIPNYHNSEFVEMKSALWSISSKVDMVVSRMDGIIERIAISSNNMSKFMEKNHNICDNNKLEDLLSRIVDTQEKVNSYLSQNKELSEGRISKLLDSVEKLISSKSNGNGGGYRVKSEKKVSTNFEDIPVFVPKLEESYSEKNIITKEIESEGTESILEKLKRIKK